MHNKFFKFDKPEKFLKHYTKLQRRLNRVINELNCSKYSLCILMLCGDTV